MAKPLEQQLTNQLEFGFMEEMRREGRKEEFKKGCWMVSVAGFCYAAALTGTFFMAKYSGAVESALSYISKLI